MLFNVRDRFDLARPESRSNSASDLGRRSLIKSIKARLRSDSTRTTLSIEANHSLGSSGPGVNSPRAIAIARAFMAS